MTHNLTSAAKLVCAFTALQLGLVHGLGASDTDAFLWACLVAVLAPLYSRRFAQMSRDARQLLVR